MGQGEPLHIQAGVQHQTHQHTGYPDRRIRQVHGFSLNQRRDDLAGKDKREDTHEHSQQDDRRSQKGRLFVGSCVL